MSENDIASHLNKLERFAHTMPRGAKFPECQYEEADRRSRLSVWDSLGKNIERVEAGIAMSLVVRDKGRGLGLGLHRPEGIYAEVLRQDTCCP